jgi:hypothetical protein
MYKCHALIINIYPIVSYSCHTEFEVLIGYNCQNKSCSWEAREGLESIQAIEL